MPPQMSFTVEFSREGLLDLRRRIDELLGETGAAASPLEPASGKESAKRKVRAVRARHGKTSWEFVVAGAQHFAEGEEFTLEGVAQAMGLGANVGKVKAYPRNGSRSERPVDGELG